MILASVYLIACEAGILKVGVSRIPEARLGGLQSGMPHPLRLVRIWERPHGDARRVERTAHRLLAAHRQGNTEWFKVSEADAIAAIEKACDAADARALKVLPREAIYVEDAEADAWAENNPGELAREIRKWSGR